MKNEVISKYNEILESELRQYLVEDDVNDIIYSATRRFEELEKLRDKKVKEKRKKGKVNSDCEDKICEYTDNEDLRENIREFCRIRELNGKPILSQGTMTRLFNLLNQYGTNDEEKTAVLEYSIDRNYPTVYPLKSGYGQINDSSVQKNKNYCQNINTPSLEGKDLEEFLLDKNDLDNF